MNMHALSSMQLFPPINIFAKYFFLVKSYASGTCIAVSQSQPFLIYLITKIYGENMTKP